MFVEYQTVQILVDLFECFYWSAQFVSILTLSSYFSLAVLSHLITNVTILYNIRYHIIIIIIITVESLDIDI